LATEIVETTVLADTAGGRPGAIDRLLGVIDRLPGPAALTYLFIGLSIALVAHVIFWASATYPIGTVSTNVLMPSLALAWFGWLLQTLNRVARETFDEFTPALDDPSVEDTYRRQLTSIRDRDAVLAGLATLVVIAVMYYGFVRQTVGTIPIEIETVSAPLWGATGFVLGIVVLHTMKQLRLVSHLSAVARVVDIFKPAPINAFSRLTAVSALGLIAFVVAYMLYTPAQPVAYVVQEVALLAVAVASFVLPLRVMHSRLVLEKRRLLSDSQERLKTVLSRVHSAIESSDIGVSDPLNNALVAVRSEIDVLEHLRTWPWSTSTIRGFVTALLLPIGLIVFTQVVSKYLGV
jgi:hypothetical protein